MAGPRPYIARLVDARLGELLDGLPALFLVGPRAAGKTTTAQRFAGSTIRLDRPAVAAAVAGDPDAFLIDQPEPVLIDEWQLVPEVLGAVKRAVDGDPRPGRFLLTGSARADMTAAGWPGTGRVVRVPMWGLTEREWSGEVSAPSIVDLLFEGALDEIQLPAQVPDVRGYVSMALRGGFPELGFTPGERHHRAWLSGYVDQVVGRDASVLGEHRDPQRLRRYFRAIAANTGQAATHKTLYDASGITRSTAEAYDALLELLFVVDRVPAWTNNRLRRLARVPKRYLVDAALLRPLLAIDQRSVVRDAGLLGPVVDTFVATQLRSEISIAEIEPAMYHLRDANGRREVDLVLEAPDGRIVGIEIKSAATVRSADARHLVWLRDELGEQFGAGVVFHAGPHAFPLDERVVALPICSIWGPGTGARSPGARSTV